MKKITRFSLKIIWFVRKLSLSLHPLLELTPFSRVFFGSFFQEAFFGLLTYTLQFKTSKYKRLAPSRRVFGYFFLSLPVILAFKRRYPFNSSRSPVPSFLFLVGFVLGRGIRDTRDRVPGATVPAGSTALGSRWLFFWRSRGFSIPFAIYPIPVVRHPGARLDDGGIQGY